MIRRILIRSAAAVGVGSILGFTYFEQENPETNLLGKAGVSVLRSLDPETAHKVSIQLARYNLIPGRRYKDKPRDKLKVNLWNREFPNPIGLAAGYDKNAEAIPGIFSMGFGFVEIGTVTPKPQPGNPQPRVFRLLSDGAIINRYGFNSDGWEVVYDRFLKYHLWESVSKDRGPYSPFKFFAGPQTHQGIIGINVGKNKEGDAHKDFSFGASVFSDFADYIVVNVSSPNTPNLRALQKKEELASLLKHVKEHLDTSSKYNKRKPRPPLLVKIAPDMSSDELKDVADVALDVGIDGIVVTNTTVSRPSTLKSHKDIVKEVGGLSGKPLFESSTAVLSEMYKLTGGKIPLVGVGGISSGKDAYEKIKSGASLVQIYTSLTFEGPGVVAKIKRELDELLEKDGYTSVADAVGANHKKL